MSLWLTLIDMIHAATMKTCFLGKTFFFLKENHPFSSETNEATTKHKQTNPQTVATDCFYVP